MKRVSAGPFAIACAVLAACAARVSDEAGEPALPLLLRPDGEHDNGWDRPGDLLSIELDLELDFESRSVGGRTVHRFRALVDDTRAIRLHAQGYPILGVEDGEGRVLEFRLEEPWLHIELGRGLARGEEAVVAVSYRATPEKGLFFFDRSEDGQSIPPQIWSQGEPEEHRHWIPLWDHPNDRASYSAHLRVDQDLVALSNGVLVGVDEHDGGERTYHWRLEQEIPTYLIAVAAGRWERYADEWRGTPVEYWVAPGTGEARARAAFGETPAMLEFFSTLLDYPYPFPRYAQVAVTQFAWGGMENATLTIENDYLLDSPEEVADREGDDRLLVAHELAHHWFGDLVTCISWSHLWLNEAWASYLELLYEGHASGRASQVLWLERYRESYIAHEGGSPAPLARDFWTQGEGERANHVYHKGPWVLYMLEHALGSEAFWQGVRHYLRAHDWDLVETEDFTRAIFDATGRNIEGWIEQWVECAGHPIFEVRLAESVGEDGRVLDLSVTQAQALVHPVPLFDLPVDVDLCYEDGRRERRVLRVNERSHQFRLPTSGKLSDVVFDASASLLCEIRMDKSAAMWSHQSALADEPALQWRAIDPLRAAVPSDATGEAEAALLTILRRSPHALLRARAARACDFAAASGHLFEVLESDPANGVRHAAVRALDGLELKSAQRERLRARLAVETSPETRTAIEELLGDER